MCERNLEFISKLISKCLRAGVSVDEVIETAKSIRPCMSYCTRARTKGDTTPGISCPSAIGRTLEDFKNKIGELMEKHEKPVSQTKDFVQVPNLPVLEKSNKLVNVCPQCGSELVHEGGCVVCHSCGWSKCN